MMEWDQMDEGPDFEELDQDGDPVGDVTTRQVQQLKRVDIPDEYMDHLGLDRGDKVIVTCKEDGILITEAKVSAVRDDA